MIKPNPSGFEVRRSGAKRPGAWLALTLSVLLSGGLLWAVEADWAAFIAITVVAGTGVLVGRRTLLHPYVWYIPPFWLYGVSHPILVWLGQAAPTGSLHDSMLLEWLALSTFVMVVGPRQVPTPTLHPLTPSRRKAAWLLLGFATIPCLLLMTGVQTAQFTESSQIVANSTLLSRYQWAVAVLTLAYLVLLGDAVLRKKRLWVPAALLTIGFGWPLLCLLIASQRSDVFRVIWVTVALMHVLHPRITAAKVAPIALGILFLAPIAQGMRGSLVAGTVTAWQEVDSPVVRVLKSEFHAGSENLALITSRWADTRFNGQSFLWDLQTTLKPNFLFPNRNTTESITNQFNIQFYPDMFAHGGGKGFSLVGEGYANFGPPGVVLVFAVVGLLIRLFYRRSARSLVSLVAYIMATPVAMVATRGDMSNIMSQWAKHVILPTLLIMYIGYLLSRRVAQGSQVVRGTGWRPLFVPGPVPVRLERVKL